MMTDSSGGAEHRARPNSTFRFTACSRLALVALSMGATACDRQELSEHIASPPDASPATEPAPIGTATQAIWATRWQDLGGDGAGDPAIASWAPGRLDVFWRSPGFGLHHRWLDNGVWTGIEDLGGSLSGNPSAVSSDVNRLDVFYFSGGNLVRRHINGNVNWNWNTETITISAANDKPNSSWDGTAVASWAPARLDVFWRGSDGHLKHVWKPNDASNWLPLGGVEDLGESLTSEPAAVSWGNLQIDVFWRDSNGAIRHKWFESCAGCNTWSTSVTRTPNGEVDGSPAVSSWASNRLDVFWKRASNGSLGHIWKTSGGSNSNWNTTGIQDLGGSLAFSPDAVSAANQVIDIVARGAAGNVIRYQYKTTDEHNPWFNDAPPATTLVANDTDASWLSSGNTFEFSVAACPSGAYAIAGQSAPNRTIWHIPSSTSTAAPTQATEPAMAANTSRENDNVMVRGPAGDLWFLRGTVLSTNCGAGEDTNCVAPTPACAPEMRSGMTLYRSSTCGQTWTSAAVFDPASANYGNGAYGGGLCWGGWDREELYFDYWSNRLFITMNGETDTEANGRSMFVLRSPAGGTGTYSFNRLNDYFAQPYMMTSLPGMTFIYSCEGQPVENFSTPRPTLRWVDPESAGWTTNNANWDTLVNSNTFHLKGLMTEACLAADAEGVDGSQSVTRVGTYVDNSGKRWWTVRLGFRATSTSVRVVTVRVNGDGDMVPLDTRTFVAPIGWTAKQLTAIEPDPAQTLVNGAWSGENTTLYYWRTDIGAAGDLLNQHKIWAAAVRDVSGWGETFQVGSGAGTVKGGDYAKGAFYYNAAVPETPLTYIMTWVGNGSVRREVVALPAGRHNN